MRVLAVWAAIAAAILRLQGASYAQDLVPRAYVITPVHANAVVLAYSFYDGTILFDKELPITDSSGTIHLPVVSFYHALNFFGRSANVAVSLPYAIGIFQADVNGSKHTAYRSGLMDVALRFSVNVKGGPAMSPDEFVSWKQKTIVGASLRILAPTGQYSSSRLVNPGANRWAFKPELGLSRRWGHWVVDTYGAVWFFTTNSEFFSPGSLSGTNTISQKPIGALEAHLSYDVRPRLWASVDGNYWYGGRKSLNGVESASSLQANSRIGATCSVPITSHQSLKFSYNYGAIIRFGGNYHNVSAAWQYSWLGRPK